MPSARSPVPSPPPPVEISKPQSVEECHLVIDALAAQIALLTEQLTLVLERLSLNSRNSSKPPSSDGPGAGMNRAQRRASERKRGAQKGHPGAWREMVPDDQIKQVHECPPPTHCECGGEVAQRGKPWRHQVFDIPPIQAEVQEYRLYSGRCAGCGKSHRAALPMGVPSGQIGPRALALVGVLASKYQMPQFKVRDFLAHILGVDFSVGAISQAHGKVAQALQAPVSAAAGTSRSRTRWSTWTRRATRAKARSTGSGQRYSPSWPSSRSCRRVPGMWRRASWGPTTASSPRV